MFSSLVKYYEGQFFELSRIVCHFFLIKLINKASKVFPSEMDLMIFCIRSSCKKGISGISFGNGLFDFFLPFLQKKRTSGISYGNGFNIFASVPPAKIMYVFSLFAFRSLRSLHASRENPKPCEWVGRVSLCAGLGVSRCGTDNR